VLENGQSFDFLILDSGLGREDGADPKIVKVFNMFKVFSQRRRRNNT